MLKYACWSARRLSYCCQRSRSLSLECDMTDSNMSHVVPRVAESTCLFVWVAEGGGEREGILIVFLLLLMKS